MLDDALLTAFSEIFYGYGEYAAPIWFVGMEEGGGNSLAEIADRLNAWDQGGRRELEDVRAYHRRFNIVNLWEGRRPALQSTWRMLIRVLLNAQGQTPDVAAVRDFQRRHWGQPQSRTCLLELLPLPSPSTAHWLYADLSTLSHLADRETYRQHYSARRAEHIRDALTTHRPQAVVCYGLEYREQWQFIAGQSMQTDRVSGYDFGQQGGTTFIAMKHPTAPGVTNAYFDSVGRRLHTAMTA